MTRYAIAAIVFIGCGTSTASVLTPDASLDSRPDASALSDGGGPPVGEVDAAGHDSSADADAASAPPFLGDVCGSSACGPWTFDGGDTIGAGYCMNESGDEMHGRCTFSCGSSKMDSNLARICTVAGGECRPVNPPGPFACYVP